MYKKTIKSASALVQAIDCHRTCDKPLPEPTKTHFPEAYMRLIDSIKNTQNRLQNLAGAKYLCEFIWRKRCWRKRYLMNIGQHELKYC